MAFKCKHYICCVFHNFDVISIGETSEKVLIVYSHSNLYLTDMFLFHKVVYICFHCLEF